MAQVRRTGSFNPEFCVLHSVLKEDSGRKEQALARIGELEVMCPAGRCSCYGKQHVNSTT
jgi:hypothetical protein